MRAGVATGEAFVCRNRDMQRALIATLLVLVVLPAAHADTQMSVRAPSERPPTLGSPTSAQLERVHVVADGSTTRLSFVLTTDAELPHAASIPIAPGGARATALAVTIGGVRTVASAMRDDEARAEFARLVELRKDPALLEQTSQGELVLRVYPLSAAYPATIEITFERTTTASVRAVNAVTSLYAGWAASGSSEAMPPTVPLPTLTPGWWGMTVEGPESATTRRVIDIQIQGLRRCFATLRREGRSVLHFVIEPDGSVDHVTIDSDHALQTCVRDEMQSWRFASAERSTRVRYPIESRESRREVARGPSPAGTF